MAFWAILPFVFLSIFRRQAPDFSGAFFCGGVRYSGWYERMPRAGDQITMEKKKEESEFMRFRQK